MNRQDFRHLAAQAGHLPDEQKKSLCHQLVVSVDGQMFSPTNTMLIKLQRPNATVVGGFRQWRNHGRTVLKGEHGMMIWIPTFSKDEEETEENVRFLTATVFDISQTAPLPDGQHD